MKNLKGLGILTIIVVFLFAMVFIPVTAEAGMSLWTDGLTYNAGYTFGGGSGTEGDPYIISGASDLAQLSVNVNGALSYSGFYFELSGNIDLAGKYWTPIGCEALTFPYDRPFSGTFIGNSYAIQHLTVDQPGEIYLGLFGKTVGALIEDLGVTDCDIEGKGCAGGIIGMADESTSIHNCFTTGTVTAIAALDESKYNGADAGGLVGYYGNANQTIDGCYSTADVTARVNAGGLVGYCINARIINSYATGSVTLTTGGYTAGGLVGEADGCIIEKCYATGNVSGWGYIGGFAGYITNYWEHISSLTNCYAWGNVTFSDTDGRAFGSFAGCMEQAVVSNCYGAGTLTLEAGTTYAGGFSGYFDTSTGTATACFYDRTKAGDREAVGTDGTGSTAFAGITGLSTVNMMGADTLTITTKMDGLDSGSGAAVSGMPIWFPHTTTPPTFIAENCTVTFDSQSATTTADPSTKSVLLGITVDALPTAPIKTSYTFGGWWTAINGGGTEFNATTPVTANITVYAKWTKEESVSVTFDSQGAATAADPATKTVLLGNTVDAMPAAPVKTGFTFGGWWTAINGGGTEFNATTPVTANITVYAKWTKEESVSVYMSARQTLTPSTPGGIWSYDANYIQLTENPDGTATIKGLKMGTTVVTYTANGSIEHFTVAILEITLPVTGQDFTWAWVLAVLAIVTLAAGLVIYKKKINV